MGGGCGVQFVELAQDPKIYDRLVDAIAPSISGDYTTDIKKAIAVQLMGGSRKVALRHLLEAAAPP